jgi:YgiT-type zinc finger domain-containing protein
MSEAKTCSVCGAQLEKARITYTQELDGVVHIVTAVPAEVCPQCGEQYLSPATVDALQELIEHGNSARETETVQVPVHHFPASA